LGGNETRRGRCHGRRFTSLIITNWRFGASALRRIGDALRQPDMFIEKPKPAKQETML
jgi:hypothetical protein